MTTDTLAALLCADEKVRYVRHRKKSAPCTECCGASHRLAARGVVVLPTDHPLRTGEPSEAMKRAAFAAFYGREYTEEDGDDWTAISDTMRAALAVLREEQ